MVKKAKTKRITHRVATGDSLLRAYNRTAKRFADDPCMVSCMVDAGFIITPRDKRGEPAKGFQVFVKMCRYDEALLRSEPTSGGLLQNKRGASLTGG